MIFLIFRSILVVILGQTMAVDGRIRGIVYCVVQERYCGCRTVTADGCNGRIYETVCHSWNIARDANTAFVTSRLVSLKNTATLFDIDRSRVYPDWSISVHG